jgi:hypothetical protein
VEAEVSVVVLSNDQQAPVVRIAQSLVADELQAVPREPVEPPVNSAVADHYSGPSSFD